MIDRMGQHYGNYRLLRLLGQGAFAEVYLSEHVYLGTQAAIKVLLGRDQSGQYEDFLQEARIIASLRHPHMLSIIDFGLENAMPFLVMQYAPNGSLRQLHPARSSLPLSTIISYVRQIASALQYAHQQQLIHRDVKPENILLGRQHELLLSDFGLALLMPTQSLSFQHSLDVSGTIPYMAPEQLRGQPCPASDQYALAVCIYEWLTCVHPFIGSPMEIALQHLQFAAPSLREKMPTISSAIEEVVLKALAKEPSHRYSNIDDFAHALELASPSEGAYEVQDGEDSRGGQISGPNVSRRPIGSSAWNIPYRRNPFFTGREDSIQRLYMRLHARKANNQGIEDDRYMEEHEDEQGRMLAICGLGGMGKTQTVIEYAYRYRSHYQAVLWARADTYSALFSDFVAMASLLHLPGLDGQDQPKIVAAVKQWLEAHTGWLLILDNVEDLTTIQDFIPMAPQGHILLTMRAQVAGTLADCIELEKMQMDEGALFLLRRAHIIRQDATLTDASNADYIEARDICQVLDGLPLALDQAGAYIEETASGLFDYLKRYRSQRTLLLERRGSGLSEHPDPVATTWLLSFQQVEQSNSAAAALLKLCAFLQPDGILEEIITAGAGELTPELHAVATEPYLLDDAIATLRKFSLLHRDPEARILTIHRLVHVVLKDSMDAEMQRQWAERAVRAVNQAFPKGDQVADWPECQRCMPNVHLCLLLIEQWRMVFPEAAHLLDQAGLYLLEHARYAMAEVFLKKALAIRRQIGGSQHVDAAESLSNLAGVYLYQGRYAMAEPLLKQALKIRQHLHGPIHLEVAIALNNLALLHHQQARYAIAEPLYRQALAIWEETQGLHHPDVARILNNLALLYQVRQQYEQAEPLYRRALAIWEHLRGPEHPDVATCLNNLALLYLRQGDFAQAEPLFQRVLSIREKTLGSQHPAVAYSLSYLAELRQQQEQYADAEMLLQHALDIRRRSLGPEHPDVAQSLNALAKLYVLQDKYSQAEPLYQEALSIREQALGPRHPDVAALLENYTNLLFALQRKDEARKLAARAKSIRAKLARKHPAKPEMVHARNSADVT